MRAVQNRNGLRTLSHSRIPPVTLKGVGLAALAVGVSTDEELLKNRTGGFGSIQHNLFHIVDVEYMWLSALQGESVPEEPSFEDYTDLKELKELSRHCRGQVGPFVTSWTNDMDSMVLSESDFNEEPVSLRQEGYRRCVTSSPHGEIMRHVLVHEIHHIGQLSVWARDIGREPVSANLRGRGLFGN